MAKMSLLVHLTILACVYQTLAMPDTYRLSEEEPTHEADENYGYDDDGLEQETPHAGDFDGPDHRRVRRQAAAMDLSLNHDKNGQPRPVGQPHGFLSADGAGNNRDNYHANLGAGVGAVAWRSPNDRHSVGVGATVDQFRGKFDGFGYRSKPNVGVGVGYKWRF